MSDDRRRPASTSSRADGDGLRPPGRGPGRTGARRPRPGRRASAAAAVGGAVGEGAGAPLRVQHVLAPARVGGAESVVRALAEGLRERGHRTRVAAVVAEEDDGHPFLDELREAGVPVDPVATSPRAYWRQWWRLRDLFRDREPDVVHTHGHRSDLLDAAVARRLGLPVVSTVHGFTGSSWRTRLYRFLQRRAFRRFDGVAAVSWPLARELVESGVPRDRVHLVPNAWTGGAPELDPPEARRRLGVAPDAFHVGWVGRLGPEKGPDVFLEALAALRDVPWTASVVGDGGEADALREAAAGLGLADRVRWHGEIPRARRLFPAFDAFVLSSRREGTPVVLLEAMAAGVPVVATAVGGVPDVVSEEEARLVPPEDPAALAGAIRRVARRPEEARNRAVRARRRLRDERDREAWVERYVRLYRSVVDRLYPGRISRSVSHVGVDA